MNGNINKLLSYFIRLNDEKKRKILDIVSYFPSFIKNIMVDMYIKEKKKELNHFKGPDNLFFFLTNRCNMRCQHCFYISELNKKDNKEEFSLDEIKEIASSLKGITKSISLTGGEPFIRSDLKDILKGFYEYGNIKSFAIMTNGFYVDKIKNFVVELYQEYPDISLSLQVSLDGLEETHNTVRKVKTSFAKAIECIQILEEFSEKYNNLQVVINSVVHKYNAEEFVEFYNQFSNRKASFIWHFLRQDERDVKAISHKKLLNYNDEESFQKAKSEDMLPDKETSFKLIDLVEKNEGDNYLTNWRKLEKKHHLKIATEGKRAVKQCVAPYKGGVLFADGGVSVCEILKPVANIRDYNFSFEATWNGPELKKQREEAKNCYCTYPCYLMDSMLYDKDTILEALERK